MMINWGKINSSLKIVDFCQNCTSFLFLFFCWCWSHVIFQTCIKKKDVIWSVDKFYSLFRRILLSGALLPARCCSAPIRITIAKDNGGILQLLPEVVFFFKHTVLFGEYSALIMLFMKQDFFFFCLCCRDPQRSELQLRIVLTPNPRLDGWGDSCSRLKINK